MLFYDSPCIYNSAYVNFWYINLVAKENKVAKKAPHIFIPERFLISKCDKSIFISGIGGLEDFSYPLVPFNAKGYQYITRVHMIVPDRKLTT